MVDKMFATQTSWPPGEINRPAARKIKAPASERSEAIPDTGEQAADAAASQAPADTTIGYLVRDVHRAFSRALQARIASHGVSMGQWFFLRALWEQDGLTQRELSQRVGMMEPTTVTALNGMERRGLVERVRNIHDRRKVNIFLTPKGRALREVLLPCSVDVNNEATRGIARSDLASAISVLLQMVTNLSGTNSQDSGFDHEGTALAAFD